MRDLRFLLKTSYGESRALVIGVNAYLHTPPLSYACNDAIEVRDLLVNELGFPADNVICLLDEQATRANILRSYFRFTKDDIGLDDRIFIFFAGHGSTLTGSRGEIGFLVPHDAVPDEYNTFVRWDELTRNAELIRAKHVLFVMDACYGGLALTRHTLPGSTRFLKDMLLRHSRQVLTAGKADETVSDAGGPLAGHSVFTGHLIEALRGNAASEGGVITASSVMAYVYARVSSDKDSNQTPHYGHFDGDGDFIFRAPGLTELEAPEDKDLDRLVMVPYPEELRAPDQTANKAQRVKALLAADHNAIELHDFLISETRRFLAVTGNDSFPVSAQWDPAELIDRLRRYEDATCDLACLLAAVAYWAKPAHLATLQKCLSRSCDQLERTGGVTVWLELRWYPLILETYYAGIAAVDAGRYDSLAALFQTPLSTSDHNTQSPLLVEAIGKSILELNRTDIWKMIPGHERNYTPLSEYLYKIIQPQLDDLLFLGKNYDSAFDTFEILLALSVADMMLLRDTGVWGPCGRFGWKHRGSSSPFDRLLQQAKDQGPAWPPIKAGMFGGSFERFERVATEYGRQLAQLHWY